MSRRPGIGASWFNRYRSDVYPSDFLISRGKRIVPPKYYDALLEQQDTGMYKAVKAARKDSVQAGHPRHKWALDKHCRAVLNDNSYERLGVKEVVKRAAIRSLSRHVEELHED